MRKTQSANWVGARWEAMMDARIKKFGNDKQQFYGLKRHLGVDFAIWRSDDSWFWHLFSPISPSGIVGASNSEAQATREARFSIEEILRKL
jgi:hypothetical protein